MRVEMGTAAVESGDQSGTVQGVALRTRARALRLPPLGVGGRGLLLPISEIRARSALVPQYLPLGKVSENPEGAQ